MTRTHWLTGTLLLGACLGTSCPGLPDIGGTGDGGNANQTEVLKMTVYATNTGGAAGLAIRPGDGKLFAVSSAGLFGPIESGADLSTMTPIGATNLESAPIFNGPVTAYVLAITETGEFWIGSRCCSRVAVVPPAGGDAAAFDGLLSAPSEPIQPTCLTLVPDGFTGSQLNHGQLLAGQDTTFSWLSAIDVAGAGNTVTMITNPSAINREAQDLAFGPGPTLYSCRGTLSPLSAGIQTIDADGVPTPVLTTLNLGVRSFVVRANSDLVILGRYDTPTDEQINGVLVYSATEQTVKLGVGLTTADTSTDGEMTISTDRSAIYLTIPNRNEIVMVEDK